MGENLLTCAQIVRNYLEATGLTLRGFAEALTEKLMGDDDTTLSHQSVMNWRDGKMEPSTDFLTLILLSYRDWRFDFALSCLGVKRPEVWGQDGGIWEIKAKAENKLCE